MTPVLPVFFLLVPVMALFAARAAKRKQRRGFEDDLFI